MAPPTARLSVRVDFAAGRLGPGKVALLEAIGKHRSLAAAARSLDMSYKRAWQLLAVLNDLFNEPVAVAYPGRNRDGSTDLTPFGARVVALYRAIERRAHRATQTDLDALDAATRSAAGRQAPPRRSPRTAAAAAAPSQARTRRGPRPG